MKNSSYLISCFLILISLSIKAADLTVPVGGSIQGAINSVQDSGGGTVTLAAGTHTITSPIQIPSDITLQGAGTYASTIKTTQNMKMIVQAGYGLKNITIQNLTLIGTNAANGGGIDIISYGADHDNINVLKVRVYQTGWGVHIKGAKNVTIQDCDFSRNGTVGQEGYAHNLYLRRCYGATVMNSTFNNSISANGINISYSEDIKIYDCEMIGNYFRGVRAADSDGFLVHGCVVSDNGNVGILANTENVVTKNVDWQNNCTSNNLVGFETKSGATGIARNNNSYGNDDDYKLVSSVSQSNNISDSNQKCGDSQVNQCILPRTDNDFSVSNTTKNYTSGKINISCASSVNITMDIEGIGNMENADYLNVYYKVNGGTARAISLNNGAFAAKSISASEISGNELEILIDAYTSYHDETYYISNILISENSPTSSVVHIKKRNEANLAIDGNHGGQNTQNVYLYNSDPNNVNQQWIEIDRGNGYYSYQKVGTSHCIDGNRAGTPGQNVYLWSCDDANQNQHWQKVSMGGGAYKLIKRNSPGYALDGSMEKDGEERNVTLWNSSSSSQNLQWIITPVSNSTAQRSNEALSLNTLIYPNPITNMLNIDYRESKGKASIISFTGLVLDSIDISEGRNTIDLSQLSSGIYLIKITDNNNNVTIKRFTKK